MEPLIITFPIPPKAHSRPRVTKKGGIYTDPKLREYYSELQKIAVSQLVGTGFQALEVPCDVELYLGKGWSQVVLRPACAEKRILRGDISNYAKAHEDALEGLLWMNDRLITRLVIEELDVPTKEVSEDGSESKEQTTLDLPPAGLGD